MDANDCSYKKCKKQWQQAQNPQIVERQGTGMEEKVYKTMNGTGALNIVLGVVALVVGVTSGVLLIIGGAKLLANKSKILF